MRVMFNKRNLENKSQLAVIQLKPKDVLGNFCSVKILITPSASPIVLR